MAGILVIAFTAWAIDVILCDGTINSEIKKILSPIGEWICALFVRSEKEAIRPKPFVVSEYYDRMEKATIEILESQEPIDQVIILWWGLDGLRLNEDGALEWISRKKPKAANKADLTQFIPPGGLRVGMLRNTTWPDQIQSTQATINEIQNQAAMQNINTQLQAQLQSYQVSYPGYYAPYFYSSILPQMQSCCCNSIIGR